MGPMQRPCSSDKPTAEIRLLMRATLATALATLVLAVATLERPPAVPSHATASSPRAAKVPATNDECGHPSRIDPAAPCRARWPEQMKWYRA